MNSFGFSSLLSTCINVSLLLKSCFIRRPPALPSCVCNIIRFERMMTCVCERFLVCVCSCRRRRDRVFEYERIAMGKSHSLSLFCIRDRCRSREREKKGVQWGREDVILLKKIHEISNTSNGLLSQEGDGRGMTSTRTDLDTRQ